MSKFKIGDRVRIVNAPGLNTPGVGKVGVVTSVDDSLEYRYRVLRDDDQAQSYLTSELIPAEISPLPADIETLKAEDVVVDSVPVLNAPDMVNHPPHYKFSNGAEVIDITEQLSFNGGNAVKYIARATRQDGKVKGNVIEDLEKAAWYVAREIERLSNDRV